MIRRLKSLGVLTAVLVGANILMLSVPVYSWACGTCGATEAVPVMGWESWRPYGGGVTEANIKANALAMTTDGLLSAGYNFVDLGDSNSVNRDGTTHLLTINATNFPSGFGGWCTYVHGLGEKCSYYLGPGPTGCNGYPGSQGFEIADAGQIAAGGADRLFYDNCTSWGSQAIVESQYQAMQNALYWTGKQIIYLVSAPYNLSGYDPWTWFTNVGGNEVYSTIDPGGATWATFMAQVDTYATDSLAQYGGPNHYLLPDYIPTGQSGVTDTEGITAFSLWSILASPLWASIDLTAPPSSTTLTTLENSEVVAVDQDVLGLTGSRVSQVSCGDANCEVYIKQLSGTNNWSAVLLNRASTTQTVSATWGSLGVSGLSGSYNLRDLWAHSNLGSMSSYSVSLASHAVAMLKLTP